MARTQTSEQHRAGQATLVAGVVPLVRHAWESLLEPHDLKGSAPKLTAAVQAILSRYGRASAAAALTAYRRQRLEAGVSGRPNLPMPSQPTQEFVRAAVEKTLSPLYGPTTPALIDATERNLAESVSQLVLEQSREATLTAVETDRAAKGWARVAEPGACAFCAMLATRGAVYKSADTAGADQNARFTGEGEFKYHDNCRCHVEPVFNAYEPTAQVRQWQAEWAQLKKDLGRSPSAYEWRRHFEGRSDGPRHN